MCGPSSLLETPRTEAHLSGAYIVGDNCQIFDLVLLLRQSTDQRIFGARVSIPRPVSRQQRTYQVYRIVRTLHPNTGTRYPALVRAHEDRQ